MKFYKKEIKNFDFKIIQLKDELVTDRHILACLGSVGLTFTSDINRFMDYLKSKNELTLFKIIEDNRSLTKEEINNLKKELKGGKK